MNVGIVGSGVVGTAVGKGLTLFGNSVVFYDANQDVLLKLEKEGYKITRNLMDVVWYSEIVFVCVPTPTVNGKINLSFIEKCATEIGEALSETIDYTVVVFKSTLLPQTTRTKLVPLLEQCSGLKVNNDFGVCVNPEFLRQQTALSDFMVPDRIVIGEANKKSGDHLHKLYSRFHCPVFRTDLDTAELVKYASNLFLASKISFFNEIYLICRELCLNAKTVSKMVSADKRIGEYGVEGGRPFEGACLPKDLDAFLSFAKEKNMDTPVLNATKKINKKYSAKSKWKTVKNSF